MNDVEQLDDDNLPAEELFMSGLFRARLPLSDGEWSDVLTVAEVSLDALYQPQVRFMCWAADESDEEPTWLHLSSIVIGDDQIRLYEDEDSTDHRFWRSPGRLAKTMTISMISTDKPNSGGLYL